MKFFKRVTSSTVLVLSLFHSCSGAANNLTATEKPDLVTVKSENGTGSVTIYTDSGFWGVPWTLSILNCTDVPAVFYKKASSINTHDGCMVLFSRQNCQGRKVQIAPGTDGHSNLGDVNFDNALASLRTCGDSLEGNPETKEASIANQRRRRREVPFFGDLMKRLGLPMPMNGNDGDGGQDSQETGNNNGGLSILRALFGSLNMSPFSSEDGDADEEVDSVDGI